MLVRLKKIMSEAFYPNDVAMPLANSFQRQTLNCDQNSKLWPQCLIFITTPHQTPWPKFQILTTVKRLSLDKNSDIWATVQISAWDKTSIFRFEMPSISFHPTSSMGMLSCGSNEAQHKI